MSSPNKLTLNTNPLQYKRARSKGVNKISKISRVSKIKKIATNDKNTENMEYSPFKMKGASLYRSPAKKYKSPAKDTGAEYNKKAKAESPSGRGLSAATIKAHDEGHATKWNPDHSDKKAKKEASPAKKKTDPPKRETSWWKGEEGLIPDELQPGVKRPKVKDTSKFAKKTNKPTRAESRPVR